MRRPDGERGRNLLPTWRPPDRQQARKRDREAAREPLESVVTPPLPTGPAGISCLASFVRGSIDGADGATAMDRATAAANGTVGYRLPKASAFVAGWIYDVTIGVDGGATGGTHWEVEVYLDGVATGIKSRIAGSTYSDQSTAQRVSIQPGQIITCVDAKSGAVNAEEGFADVWGRLEGHSAAAGV